jgi:hypothetical protein
MARSATRKTAGNYRPKTGNEFESAANIIGSICISLMNSAAARYGVPRLQMISGSSYMPESGGRGRYLPRERRVSLACSVTRRSRHAFPVATGDIPPPADPGERR